jgi:hypothetical protein
MRRWQSLDASVAAGSTRCTSHQLLELRALQGVFLERHLDMLPDSRKIAFEVAAYKISKP